MPPLIIHQRSEASDIQNISCVHHGIILRTKELGNISHILKMFDAAIMAFELLLE